MAKQFTLGKNERLKSRKLIDELFQKGNSFSLYPLKVFYIVQDADEPLRFGAGVSTKNFKKAVDRNRIKRLLRETYRLQKIPLQEKLRVNNKQLNSFFIYTGKELPEFELVKRKVGVALEKLSEIIDENNIANP